MSWRQFRTLAYALPGYEQSIYGARLRDDSEEAGYIPRAIQAKRGATAKSTILNAFGARRSETAVNK